MWIGRSAKDHSNHQNKTPLVRVQESLSLINIISNQTPIEVLYFPAKYRKPKHVCILMKQRIKIRFYNSTSDLFNL
jgi:hypothetical protein